MRRTVEFVAVLSVISMTVLVLFQTDAATDESDTVDIVEVDNDRSALPYMTAICGDGAQMLESRQEWRAACGECPQGSSAHSGSLSLIGGYVGDFSGDGHTEAILATEGCGGGFNFRFSTVVLRQLGADWQMLEYVDAVSSHRCEPIATLHGARIFCQHTDVGGGAAVTAVTLRWVEEGSLMSESLTRLIDETGSCRYDGEYKRTIEEQIIDDLDDDGNVELALRIRSAHGEPVRDDIGVDERCDEELYEFSETETLKVWKIESDGVSRDDNLAKFIDD